MSTFTGLGIDRWLSEALAAMAINRPSEIQRSCIKPILDGKDVIGGARTGSGKTIAFAAPMLNDWAHDPWGICGLVLTPTRELAIQIAEQFKALGATMNIRVSVVVGGADMTKQAIELQRKPHFVIATPGRLADHIRSSGEDTIGGLRRVRYLVLDEADRLLSASLASDLAECMEVIPPPKKRQTLLFTATVTDSVRQLAENKPDVMLFEQSGTEGPGALAVPETLKQLYLLCPSYVKLAYLYSLLTSAANNERTAIVFVNRTTTAEHLRRTLQLLEVRTTSLHSQMPQQQRLNALGRFRAGAARVLVATDVASRGLDIPSVALVVNFDIPADPDDYVHRAGRTARAGREGTSVCLVGERDVQRIEAIENRVGKKLEECTLVTDKDVADHALRKVSKAKREALIDMDRDHFGEQRKIQKHKAAMAKSSR